MKKIMMVVVASLMATLSANAQFEKGTWSLQPYYGGVVSSVTNAGSFDIDDGVELKKKMTVGFIIGGEAEYQFADKFSIAAGLNYTSQGCGWKDFDYWEGPVKVEVKDQSDILGYIKIPIVANYYIFKGFAVKTGVQLGFLVTSKFYAHGKSKMDILGDGVNRELDLYATIDMKDQYKKFDFSIPIGVSYQFKVPITIDARYQIGLTKLNKESVAGVKDSKNSVFTLTVGYKFAL
ncbi:MAG: PorT family protein [Prevotella sp.]|nr:PorT family protein [Prevotella sp.]